VAFAPVGGAAHQHPEGVAVVDLATGTAGKIYRAIDFPGGSGFHKLAASPDGKYLFAVNGGECLVRYRVQGATFALEEVGPRIAQNPHSVSFSPESKYVCLPSGGGNSGNNPGHPKVPSYSTFIYAVTNLKAPVAAIHQGGYPRCVAIDTKAGKIYSQNSAHQLLIFSAKGELQQQLEFAPRDEGTVQILLHPDGSRLMVLTPVSLYCVALKK
jgi:hypothetical protein